MFYSVLKYLGKSGETIHTKIKNMDKYCEEFTEELGENVKFHGFFQKTQTSGIMPMHAPGETLYPYWLQFFVDLKEDFLRR